MRLRLCLFFASALLFGCEKEPAPLQLDFLGATRFTSSDRLVQSGDTLTTRLYAEGRADDAQLRRLRITTTYAPGRSPYLYPTALGAFNPANLPPPQTLVYLDSVLPASVGREMLYQTTFGARSTSGTERWDFVVTDAAQRTATRTFELRVRKADSAAVVHTYTLIANPAAVGSLKPARPFLELGTGLLLPKFSVRTQPDNQALIDLLFVSRPGSLTLESPAAALAGVGTGNWPSSRRHTTRLRLATVTADNFSKATTAEQLRSAYATATVLPNPQVSPALTEKAVLAFETDALKHGLILITAITRVPSPVIKCTVRVEK